MTCYRWLNNTLKKKLLLSNDKRHLSKKIMLGVIMNYAIVFAGGVGSRMKSPDLPKQFIEVNGKPIIVYTLEHFQKHEDIKGIIVVCLEQWIPHMVKLVAQFELCKVLKVVKGGSTGQESIYNGRCAPEGIAQPAAVVR